MEMSCTRMSPAAQEHRTHRAESDQPGSSLGHAGHNTFDLSVTGKAYLCPQSCGQGRVWLSFLSSVHGGNSPYWLWNWEYLCVVADDSDSVLKTFGHPEPPHPEGPVGSIAISQMVEVPDTHYLASRWEIAAWYDLTKSEWGRVYQKSIPCLASLLFHLISVSSAGHSQEYSLKKITSRKILLSGPV